jgi:PAS domain S-box-containing protein
MHANPAAWSAALMQHWFDRTDDVLAALDRDGCLLQLNPAAARFFDVLADRCTGRSAFEGIHPEDRTRTEAEFKSWITAGSPGAFRCENRWIGREQRVRTVAWTILPLKITEDAPEAFIACARDRTTEHDLERALRDSEQRFRAIFEHSLQFLGLLKPDGTILEVNQAALEATGVSRDDVLGKPVWTVRWWSFAKATAERVEREVQAAQRGERVRFEVDMRGPADALIEMELSLQPVRDESGALMLLILEGRDLTRSKRAERAENNLMRSLAALGESAGVIAHEIKNPITAVNVALCAVADELGEDHKAILEDLVARMQRVHGLMQRTLTCSKPVVLRRVACDMRTLFDDTVAHLRMKIEQANAQLEIEIDPSERSLACDPVLLEEVLSNLITNAIEAKERDVNIRLSARREGAWTAIAVEDDGPGIPPAARGTLFKPFTTTKRRGTGLGLSICKKIVDEHGGTITVEDGLRGGARFTIRLPNVPERVTQ